MIDLNRTSSITDKQYSIDSNNQICESFDCESDATNRIEIDCGEYGKLPISVCDNCLCKFCHVSNVTLVKKEDLN